MSDIERLMRAEVDDLRQSRSVNLESPIIEINMIVAICAAVAEEEINDLKQEILGLKAEIEA